MRSGSEGLPAQKALLEYEEPVCGKTWQLALADDGLVRGGARREVGGKRRRQAQPVDSAVSEAVDDLFALGFSVLGIECRRTLTELRPGQDPETGMAGKSKSGARALPGFSKNQPPDLCRSAA